MEIKHAIQSIYSIHIYSVQLYIYISCTIYYFKQYFKQIMPKTRSLFNLPLIDLSIVFIWDVMFKVWMTFNCIKYWYSDTSSTTGRTVEVVRVIYTGRTVEVVRAVYTGWWIKAAVHQQLGFANICVWFFFFVDLLLFYYSVLGGGVGIVDFSMF